MKIAHDPLPIDASAEGYKGKKTSKTTPDSTGEIDKKELRPSGDRSVELDFGFCFQQNAYGGWGRGLRYTGRGLWRAKRAYRRSAGIADIARDRKGKGKILPRINADKRGSAKIAGIARHRRHRAGSEKQRQNLPRINNDERGSVKIAGIARHRRHRAGSERQRQNLPRINADKRGSGHW